MFLKKNPPAIQTPQNLIDVSVSPGSIIVEITEADKPTKEAVDDALMRGLGIFFHNQRLYSTCHPDADHGSKDDTAQTDEPRQQPRKSSFLQTEVEVSPQRVVQNEAVQMGELVPEVLEYETEETDTEVPVDAGRKQSRRKSSIQPQLASTRPSAAPRTSTLSNQQQPQQPPQSLPASKAPSLSARNIAPLGNRNYNDDNDNDYEDVDDNVNNNRSFNNNNNKARPPVSPRPAVSPRRDLDVDVGETDTDTNEPLPPPPPAAQPAASSRQSAARKPSLAQQNVAPAPARAPAPAAAAKSLSTIASPSPSLPPRDTTAYNVPASAKPSYNMPASTKPSLSARPPSDMADDVDDDAVADRLAGRGVSLPPALASRAESGAGRAQMKSKAYVPNTNNNNNNNNVAYNDNGDEGDNGLEYGAQPMYTQVKPKSQRQPSLPSQPVVAAATAVIAQDMPDDDAPVSRKRPSVAVAAIATAPPAATAAAIAVVPQQLQQQQQTRLVQDEPPRLQGLRSERPVAAAAAAAAPPRAVAVAAVVDHFPQQPARRRETTSSISSFDSEEETTTTKTVRVKAAEVPDYDEPDAVLSGDRALHDFNNNNKNNNVYNNVNISANALAVANVGGAAGGGGVVSSPRQNRKAKKIEVIETLHDVTYRKVVTATEYMDGEEGEDNAIVTTVETRDFAHNDAFGDSQDENALRAAAADAANAANAANAAYASAAAMANGGANGTRGVIVAATATAAGGGGLTAAAPAAASAVAVSPGGPMLAAKRTATAASSSGRRSVTKLTEATAGGMAASKSWTKLRALLEFAKKAKRTVSRHISGLSSTPSHVEYLHKGMDQSAVQSLLQSSELNRDGVFLIWEHAVSKQITLSQVAGGKVVHYPLRVNHVGLCQLESQRSSPPAPMADLLSRLAQPSCTEIATPLSEILCLAITDSAAPDWLHKVRKTGD